MRTLYRQAALTDDESRSLAALFESTAGAGTVAPGLDRRIPLVVTALGGALAAISVIALGWKGRVRGVRRRLVASTRAARAHTEGKGR